MQCYGYRGLCKKSSDWGLHEQQSSIFLGSSYFCAPVSTLYSISKGHLCTIGLQNLCFGSTGQFLAAQMPGCCHVDSRPVEWQEKQLLQRPLRTPVSWQWEACCGLGGGVSGRIREGMDEDGEGRGGSWRNWHVPDLTFPRTLPPFSPWT